MWIAAKISGNNKFSRIKCTYFQHKDAIPLAI